MAVQQQDIARTLRPFTLHAQQVMAQARAGVERLPAVLMLVQRALDHAGLADTFRLLPDLDQESAARGAKSGFRTETGSGAGGPSNVKALRLPGIAAPR
jgi:hypothetical protein